MTSVAFSPDGRTLASGSEDGTVRVWEVATGEELVALYSADVDRDWLAVTPEGYYNASPNSQRFIRWRVGNKLYPAQKLTKQFKRPDLVGMVLRGKKLP